MTNPGRVWVVRALPGLGDMMCAVPALRSLRRGLPDAHVTLVGLPSAGWMLERFPDLLDDLIAFPGFPGIPEVPFDARRTAAFLAAAASDPPDLVLAMHGSGRVSNLFAALLGAPTTVGFEQPGDAGGLALTPYPAGRHEIRRMLALVAALGFDARDERLEFPLQDDDRRRSESLRTDLALSPARYACVHPGASLAHRRWSTAGFAAVCDGLAERGLTPVLTGTASDREPVRAVLARARHPVRSAVGRTTLGTLAALLADAAVTVTNDTGTSHLAAAVGAASVVIFSGSHPQRWAPIDADRHRALPRDARTPLVAEGCCLQDGCAELGDPVLDPVTPSQVLAEVDLLVRVPA